MHRLNLDIVSVFLFLNRQVARVVLLLIYEGKYKKIVDEKLPYIRVILSKKKHC